MEAEGLTFGLNAIVSILFAYARAHVANVRPQDENVMIGLINFKKKLIDIINKE